MPGKAGLECAKRLRDSRFEGFNVQALTWYLYDARPDLKHDATSTGADKGGYWYRYKTVRKYITPLKPWRVISIMIIAFYQLITVCLLVYWIQSFCFPIHWCNRDFDDTHVDIVERMSIWEEDIVISYLYQTR